jgi:YggT family protein
VHGDWLYSRPISFLINAADSACRPFRRLLDRLNIRTGILDFSPLLALLALQIAQRVVIGALLQMSGGTL